MNSDLKTSKDWYEIHSADGLIIYDPDGWDRTNYEFSFNEELITEDEFMSRVMKSTVLRSKQ